MPARLIAPIQPPFAPSEVEGSAWSADASTALGTNERLVRSEIVAAARESIARGSKSFAAASKLFAPATRERAWLLYAWCRRADDIADGQEHGHGMSVQPDAVGRVERLAAMTDAALAGQRVDDPAFDALRLVTREAGLPPALVRDVVRGFRLDAEDWRPRTEADLYRYCYHVAGAVGCLMAIVMGVAPDDDATLDRACDLGLAFQLSNIARDIAEDDRVGRCYLPVEWLVEMDIPPGQHIKPPYRDRLTVLARRLIDAAARFEASARVGTPALSFRSAWAVLAAADIYGAIGRQVAARGTRAWDRRITTTGMAKIGMIARAGWLSLRRTAAYPPAPSDTPWHRPRPLDATPPASDSAGRGNRQVRD